MTDTTMSNSKQNLFAMPSTASVAVAGRSRARRNIEWSPSDFIIGKSLGHGTFGSIYMARCCRRQYGGVRVALKRFSKTKILESAQRNAMRNAELLLEREISIHSRLRHENIVGYYGTVDTARHFSLVLELTQGGDLCGYHHCHLNAQQLSTSSRVPRVKHIVRQVAQALDYLQREHRIAHRDIKPENILVFENTSESKTTPSTASTTNCHAFPIIKLCDFGWGMDYGQTPWTRTLCGTSEFVAAEMLYAEEEDAAYRSGVCGRRGHYSRRNILRPRRAAYQPQYVDSWALGVLTYELLHDHTPFAVLCDDDDNAADDDDTNSRADDRSTIFERIRNFCGFETEGCSRQDYLVGNFLNGLMHTDPLQRATPSAALRHEFLRDTPTATANTMTSAPFGTHPLPTAPQRHVTMSPPPVAI